MELTDQSYACMLLNSMGFSPKRSHKIVDLEHNPMWVYSEANPIMLSWAYSQQSVHRIDASVMTNFYWILGRRVVAHAFMQTQVERVICLWRMLPVSRWGTRGVSIGGQNATLGGA